MRRRIIVILATFFVIYFTIPRMAEAGSQHYFYDEKNRLSEIKLSSGEMVQHFYDNNGNVIRSIRSSNFLQNSGFEIYSGSLKIANSWYTYQDAGVNGQLVADIDHVNGGQRSQRMSASQMPKNTQLNISQDVKIEPGKPFTASGRYYIEALMNARVDLVVDFLDSTGTTYVGHAKSSYTYSTENRYITLATNGTVPNNAAFARIYATIWALEDGASGTVYVDSMEFK